MASEGLRAGSALRAPSDARRALLASPAMGQRTQSGYPIDLYSHVSGWVQLTTPVAN